MAFDPLNQADKATLATADRGNIRNALAGLGGRIVPPWLRPGHTFPNGDLPKSAAAFAAVPSADLIETIAVRGPLHAIDGWGLVGRSINALICGDAHNARHLAYYAELRGALSILASSGVGIFNRRNVVVNSSGSVAALQDRPTHDMCWATISHWATLNGSLDMLVEPIQISGVSLLDPLRDFFPGSSSTALGSYLMGEWGFDLVQGAQDRDERNWSSYQPTALVPINTSPADDIEFLTMLWKTLRPGSNILERHLLRILLEVELRSLGETMLSEREERYTLLSDSVKASVTMSFLTREDEPADHPFLVHVADQRLPAHPYAMLCRAALLLKLATGISEANLLAAGVQPAVQFDGWWRQFGLDHGLWSPPNEPANSLELWDDVDAALEDVSTATIAHRHDWIAALANGAFRLCETERVALWGLFR